MEAEKLSNLRSPDTQWRNSNCVLEGFTSTVRPEREAGRKQVSSHAERRSVSWTADPKSIYEFREGVNSEGGPGGDGKGE